MRVLMVVTYYRPHLGGVAVAVQRLAEGLATRGHQVTVLTSRHTRAVPRRERFNGVDIVRVPVILRLVRSPAMPGFIPLAVRLARQCDVVAVHIPLVEAGLVCWLGRRLGKRVVVMYHCDFEPSSGLLSRLAPRVMRATSVLAGACSDQVIATTQDYADHSELLRRFKSKVRVVPPPVTIDAPVPRPGENPGARRGRAKGPMIAVSARLAPEKGVEYVLEAIPQLLQRYPHLVVTLTGEPRPDIGCEGYFRRLKPLIDLYRDQIHFAGVLDASEMPGFFAAADVLVLPSVDGREAFGMVQVEAMLCGTPVVASNLPGMRQPVQRTGMGVLVPPRDPHAIAEAIRTVVDDHFRYERRREDIERLFSSDRAVDEYEAALQGTP